MTGDDRAALRYAVASNVGTIGPEFSREAAYAGPHLLVVSSGIQHMSSPCSPSTLTVEELHRLDVLTDASDLAASLERGVEGLRETFRNLLVADPPSAGTGTLFTAMLWRGTHAVIAHIGSTRAYLLRSGELTQLTRDHTLGQLLVEAGSIRPDEMGSDPRHDAVARWLDGEPGEPADIIAHEAAIGDRYLLCTGGIDRMMSPRILRDILRDTARDPRDVADDVAAMAFPAERYRSFICIVADVVERAR